MTDVIKRLRERRLNVWEQAKALADKAAEQNRAFEAEEQSTWDTLNAELDALDRRMKSIADAETRAKETEDAFAQIEGRPREAGNDARTNKTDAELRAWLRGDNPHQRFFDVKPPEGRPVNYRNLTKGVATAGGNTVPETFFERLMEHLIETSAILQTLPTVLDTASGENILVPKTTAHSTSATVAEGGTILPSDPAFGQVTLGAIKKGHLIQVSRELVDDTGVDLLGYLARESGRALGNAHGADWVATAVADSSLGVTGPAAEGGGFGVQSAAGEGFDLLIDLFHSVIAPYRASRSAFWLLNDQTAATVRKIKNADGVYAWQPSVVAGQPDLILSKPVAIDPNVPDIAVSTESILFGDWSTFFVRIAGGVRFERSDDFAFDSDLVSFRALMRADAALVDLTGSIKHFLGGAS